MDGLLYWQINDLWPRATWSSIDAYGRWKALHFLAKRCFEPVHISLLEDQLSHEVAIHCSNQGTAAVNLTVHWKVGTCDGRVFANGHLDAAVPPQQNLQLHRIACADWAAKGGQEKLPLEVRQNPDAPSRGDRDLLVWAWAEIDGQEVSRNLAFFPNQNISTCNGQTSVTTSAHMMTVLLH